MVEKRNGGLSPSRRPEAPVRALTGGYDPAVALSSAATQGDRLEEAVQVFLGRGFDTNVPVRACCQRPPPR
ncbi:MAG: hypothetical protein ABGY41_18975, partial [Candidatus Poribacteria bacterium]